MKKPSKPETTVSANLESAFANGTEWFSLLRQPTGGWVMRRLRREGDELVVTVEGEPNEKAYAFARVVQALRGYISGK